MLNINNRNYDIQVALFTATKQVAIGGKYKDENAVQLVSQKISEFEIHESLLCPYFTGHFTYSDTMFSSNLNVAASDGRTESTPPERPLPK